MAKSFVPYSIKTMNLRPRGFKPSQLQGQKIEYSVKWYPARSDVAVLRAGNFYLLAQIDIDPKDKSYISGYLLMMKDPDSGTKYKYVFQFANKEDVNTLFGKKVLDSNIEAKIRKVADSHFDDM